MGGDLCIVTVEGFEYHDFGSSFKPGSVEYEGDIDLAVRLVGLEGEGAANFLAVRKERFSGGLVHQHALDRIFLAGGEIFVGDNILNFHSAACGDFLFAVHRRFCADFGDFYLYGLPIIIDIRMNGKLFAVLIQRFKNHKACVFPNKPCVKGKGHGDCAVRRFGREYSFGCYRISVFDEGFSGAFVHKRSHEYIFLAGDEVAVGYGIGQREHLGCTDFLLAVNRGLRPDFGNTVVDNGNADGLPVFTDANGIDFLVGEIAVRRLQFLHKPVAVRDFLEHEQAVFAGFVNQHSGFFCEFACVCTEQSEHGACDALFGFTVDFETLYRAVNEFVLDGFAAVCFDLHKGGILSGVVEGHGVLFIREDIVAVGCDFLYIQLCAYRNIRLECDVAVFIAVCNFKQTVSRNG